MKEETKEITKSDQCKNCENRGQGGELLQCSQCSSVSYCSKKCQVSHWRSKHRKGCARLQSEAEMELGTPMMTMNKELYIDQKDWNITYRFAPPNGLKADERFWIKVQSNDMNCKIMICDKSQTCCFLLPPDQNGHRELVEKVSHQKTFLGGKSYFKAKFNEKGRAIVYLHTSTALKW
jgi:hypothetical protein